MSWSSLKEITRVASEETEDEWLAFAAEHTVTELRAETQDARRKKRDRPRDDRFGLPDLITRIVLELTQDERARLDAVFEQMSGELAERMGGEPLSPKDLFLYMAERFLATGGEAPRW